MIELLAGSSVIRERSVKRWRKLHCNVCHTDFVYEQMVTGKGFGFNLLYLTYATALAEAEKDAETDLQNRKHTLKHSAVYCPECGSYPDGAYQAAAREWRDALAARTAGAAIRCLDIMAGVVIPLQFIFIFLSMRRALSDLDGPLISFLVLDLMVLFLASDIANLFILQDLNTNAQKAERIQDKQENVMLRCDFEAMVSNLPERERLEMAANTE